MERLSAGELTGNQLLMLPIVASFPSSPSLSDLAEASRTSHQNTRSLLNKLERRGYVDLSLDEKDNRILRTSLTKKGTQMVEEYYETMKGPVREMYEGLSDSDIEAALRVIAVLSERLDYLHPE